MCVCVCDKLLQLWVAISCSRDLPDPGIEPTSLESPALAGRIFLPLNHLGNLNVSGTLTFGEEGNWENAAKPAN